MFLFFITFLEGLFMKVLHISLLACLVASNFSGVALACESVTQEVGKMREVRMFLQQNKKKVFIGAVAALAMGVMTMVVYRNFDYLKEKIQSLNNNGDAEKAGKNEQVCQENSVANDQDESVSYKGMIKWLWNKVEGFDKTVLTESEMNVISINA